MTLSYTNWGPNPVGKKAEKGGIMQMPDYTGEGKQDIEGLVKSEAGERRPLMSNLNKSAPKRKKR